MSLGTVKHTAMVRAGVSCMQAALLVLSRKGWMFSVGSETGLGLFLLLAARGEMMYNLCSAMKGNGLVPVILTQAGKQTHHSTPKSSRRSPGRACLHSPTLACSSS